MDHRRAKINWDVKTINFRRRKHLDIPPIVSLIQFDLVLVQLLFDVAQRSNLLFNIRYSQKD